MRIWLDRPPDFGERQARVSGGFNWHEGFALTFLKMISSFCPCGRFLFYTAPCPSWSLNRCMKTDRQTDRQSKPKPGHLLGRGFSLAELLVSLLILAEIATFSIPKILSAQQASTKRAKAKEVAAMIAAAHQRLQLESGVSAATTMGQLMPYYNYLAVDTTSTIDREANVSGASFLSCSGTSSWATCLRLPSGGIILFEQNSTLSSSSGNNYVLYDPDGTYSGTTDGKGVSFYLSLNGRLTTIPADHPNWFSW